MIEYCAVLKEIQLKDQGGPTKIIQTADEDQDLQMLALRTLQREASSKGVPIYFQAYLGDEPRPGK